MDVYYYFLCDVRHVCLFFLSDNKFSLNLFYTKKKLKLFEFKIIAQKIVLIYFQNHALVDKMSKLSWFVNPILKWDNEYKFCEMIKKNLKYSHIAYKNLIWFAFTFIPTFFLFGNTSIRFYTYRIIIIIIIAYNHIFCVLLITTYST